MKLIKRVYRKITELVDVCFIHHGGAFAAQSAFYFFITLIPIILLLLTLIQYTPVTKGDVLEAVVVIFPDSVSQTVVSIVNQVYTSSLAVIPITVIAAIWSASRGVLSITNGLNIAFDCEETRNYFILRARASLYTILFVIVLVASLVLSVFGNTLHDFLAIHLPTISRITGIIIQARLVTSFIILVVFLLLIYKFLPDRKSKIVQLLPGAVLTTIGWILLSYIFSVYLDVFEGFATMYGSLTTIVLIMLWLYFCMFITLYGAKLNLLLEKKAINRELFRLDEKS